VLPITTAVMLSRLAAIQFAMVAPSHAAVAISHALVAASISAYCPCQACCICRITVSISAIGARALGKIIMRLRRFGRTGRDLSEIGFGAWAIGADWGHVEANDASATLNAALDAGMTFIDTADVYGDGRSERLIADVIKETGGERPFVATKAADVFDPLDQLGESGKIRHYGVSVGAGRGRVEGPRLSRRYKRPDHLQRRPAAAHRTVFRGGEAAWGRGDRPRAAGGGLPVRQVRA